MSNGENINIRKIRDSDGYQPTDGKGFHEGVIWDDIIIPPFGLSTVATSPDNAIIQDGLRAYAFTGAGVQVEQLNGSFEIPHNYKEGTNLSPHVHWLPSDDSAGDVKWQFEYAIVNATGTLPASTIITGVQATSEVELQHQIVETGEIDGTLLQIGTVCYFRLFRDSADAEDTYTEDAILASIGIHYQADGDGSRFKTSK